MVWHRVARFFSSCSQRVWQLFASPVVDPIGFYNNAVVPLDQSHSLKTYSGETGLLLYGFFGIAVWIVAMGYRDAMRIPMTTVDVKVKRAEWGKSPDHGRGSRLLKVTVEFKPLGKREISYAKLRISNRYIGGPDNLHLSVSNKKQVATLEFLCPDDLPSNAHRAYLEVEADGVDNESNRFDVPALTSPPTPDTATPPP